MLIQVNEQLQREITQRKQMEADTLRPKEFSEILINSSVDGIIAFDHDCHYTIWNPAMECISGVSKSETLGRCAFDVFPFLKETGEDKFFFEALAGRIVVARDREYIVPETGRRGFFEAYYSPLINEAGEIIGGLAIIRDITEHKQTEEMLSRALEESRQRQAEISALLKGSRSVMEYHEFQDAARAIFASCKNLVGAAAGYVALLSEEGMENEVLFLDSGGLPCAVNPSLLMPIRGLRGEVYRTGKAIYHNKFSASEWVKYMPEGHVALDNVLFAPLVIDRKVVGLIGLANKPGGFTANDARLASAFGEFAAIALLNSWEITERQKAEAELQRNRNHLAELVEEKTEELRIINKQLQNEIAEHRLAVEATHQNYDIQTALNSILYLSLEDISLEEILKRTIDIVLSIPWLSFESRGGIFLARDDTEMLEIKVQKGLPESLLLACTQVPFGKCLCGRAAALQEIQFSDGVDARHEITYEGITPHGGYAVPILSTGRVIGVIHLYLKEGHRRDRREEEFLTAVANTLAGIIKRKQVEAALEAERALLSQKVKERTSELSAANAELARADRLKDEFLASMSHELRTPLSAILGMSEGLQEEVYGPLNDKQMKCLRGIEESGRHLLSLINDILDVSKIAVGKLALEIGPVSVEAVCEASLRFIKQDAQKKRLHVSSTIDNSVTTFQGDERRLKQILVNLLSNAVKFTKAGGTIGLEVVGDSEHHAVRFIVWDTGIGISPEQMPLLFKPFTQLDSSLSRQQTGTGLGLALVHRLVELHQGGISVESEVGQGSRFTVSLPWYEQDEKIPTLSSLLPTATGKSTLPVATVTGEQEVVLPLILLVEDNEVNLGITSDYLLAKGYRVTVARNGTEAIQRVKEEKPAVILMDIQIPDLDGLEVTRLIRADAHLSDIPIIALTALAMPGDRERCLEAGANDYISRPVSFKELILAVEAQVKRNPIST
ncbi:response regulator [Candidatus Poribacteria bacterium]|nr:response regulator [Candidatus Poribacteria bacterium]